MCSLKEMYQVLRIKSDQYQLQTILCKQYYERVETMLTT